VQVQLLELKDGTMEFTSTTTSDSTLAENLQKYYRLQLTGLLPDGGAIYLVPDTGIYFSGNRN